MALPAGLTLRLAHSATRLDKDALAGERATCTPVPAAGNPGPGTPAASVAAIAGNYDAPRGSWSQSAFERAGLLPGLPLSRTAGLVRLPGVNATAPQQTTPAAAPGANGAYTVQPDDTLHSLCQRQGLEAKALVAANKQALTRLRPGDVLIIPGPAKGEALPGAGPALSGRAARNPSLSMNGSQVRQLVGQ